MNIDEEGRESLASHSRSRIFKLDHRFFGTARHIERVPRLV